MSVGRWSSPSAATPAATAPDDTSTTSCPSWRALATSPASTPMAASSIAPRSSVTDDVPTFTTTRTPSLPVLEAELADPHDVAVGGAGARQQPVHPETIEAVADVGRRV